MAEKRYTIELTSEEITELVSAIHSREYSIKDAILQAKRHDTPGTLAALEHRLALIKVVGDRVRNADA